MFAHITCSYFLNNLMTRSLSMLGGNGDVRRRYDSLIPSLNKRHDNTLLGVNDELAMSKHVDQFSVIPSDGTA